MCHEPCGVDASPLQKKRQEVFGVQDDIVTGEEGPCPECKLPIEDGSGEGVQDHRRRKHVRVTINGGDAGQVRIDKGFGELRVRGQQMHAAGRAWIAFERVDLSLGRLYKVKCDLAGEVVLLHEVAHPFEDGGMFDMLKGNRRTLPGSEVRFIGCVRGEMSVVAHAVRAVLFALDIFLRDPRLFRIQFQRG